MNSGRRIYRILAVLTALALLGSGVPVLPNLPVAAQGSSTTPVPPPPGSPGGADLLAQLADQDAGVRLQAAYQLGELWPTDYYVVKALIQAAGDPDPQVRTVATYALGKTRQATSQAVSTLISRLRDESPQVRYSAARALGRIGPAAQAAVPVLQGALRDKDENLGYVADENLRYAAVEALAQIGVSEDTIPALIDALADPSWYVASRASDLLVTYGEAGAGTLVKAFRDAKEPTEWARQHAILRTLTKMPNAAAPRLSAILAEGPLTDDSLKALSAAGLGQMGPLGHNEMIAAAQGGSLIATDALVQYGGQAIPVLSAIVTNPPPSLSPALRVRLRTRAIDALGAIGAPSAGSLLDLLDKLSPVDVAYKTVIENLGAIAADPANVIPKLLDVLRNTQAATEVRAAAANALSAYGTEAGDAISDLQRLLRAQDQDANLRVAAAGALGKIGPGRPEVIAGLSGALAGCDDVASSAASALGGMGPVAQDTVPALVAALRCPYPQVPNPKIPAAAAAAAAALGEMRPISATVTSALVEQLARTDGDGQVAESAAKASGRIGPGALSPLVTALTISETTSIASTAFVKIGPPALPFLIQGLGQGDLPARQRILETLYAMKNPHAFEGFQWALQDPGLAADLQKPENRTKLEGIYGKFSADIDGSTITVTTGFAVPEALPYLIGALLPVTTTIIPVTTTVALRSQAARAIGFVGPDAAPAVPALALALADSDTTLQCEAALALLLIGPGAGAAAPALTAALTDADAGEDAVCVLERKDNEGESADDEDKNDIFRMLGARQPTGYRLLQADLLAGKNKIGLRRLLIYALAGLGPQAEVTVPDLANSLRTPALRRPAAEALAQIGAAAHPALLESLRPSGQMLSTPGLAEALAGFDSDLRRSAAYALRQNQAMWDPMTAEAIRSLIQNEGEDRSIRAMLASAVAAQGQPLPGFWEETGLTDPASTICPGWPAMPKKAGMEVAGLDLYTDTCVYRPGSEAPPWREFYRWLMSHW